MRKQVPPEKTKDVLEFATKRPQDRLNSIKNGLSVSSMFLFPKFVIMFCMFLGLELWAIRVRPPVRHACRQFWPSQSASEDIKAANSQVRCRIETANYCTWKFLDRPALSHTFAIDPRKWCLEYVCASILSCSGMLTGQYLGLTSDSLCPPLLIVSAL
jgi:hypothetical protein